MKRRNSIDDASVSVHLDADQQSRETHYALCPHCGQKLLDVLTVLGVSRLRCQCRRCRRYSLVDLS